jgi:hypothetical protein
LFRRFHGKDVFHAQDIDDELLCEGLIRFLVAPREM